jgi:hypothetical protein
MSDSNSNEFENQSFFNDSFNEENFLLIGLYDNFNDDYNDNCRLGGKNELNLEEHSFDYFHPLLDGFNFNEKIEKDQQNSEENTSKTTEEKTENKNQKEEFKTEKTEYIIKTGSIFSINKEPKIKVEENEIQNKNLLGKKRYDENHTKNAFDNIVRKIKSKLFGAIIIILNKSLEEKKNIEEKKIKKKENQKEKKGEIKNECFLKPEQPIILQTNVKENLELLDMKLREIFSKNVSQKVKNFSKEHQLNYNKNFIEKIKDDPRKQKTNEILDMTFFQCMEHFRGTKKYEALDGLEIEYENVIKDMNDDIEYKNNFIEHLRKFEILFRNKKPRKSKKKKINKDEDFYY